MSTSWTEEDVSASSIKEDETDGDATTGTDTGSYTVGGVEDEITSTEGIKEDDELVREDRTGDKKPSGEGIQEDENAYRGDLKMTTKIPKKEKRTRKKSARNQTLAPPKFHYNTMGDPAVKQIGIQRQTTK